MKVLGGIISIIIIVFALAILRSGNGYTSGGLIIIVPLIWLIQWIWTSFVNPKPKNIIANTNIAPTEDNISDISYNSKDIPMNSPPTQSNPKLSIFTRLINFLTFNNSTYRSVFSEGGRRILLISSFITPFILAYIYTLFVGGFTSEETMIIVPFFYILHHILILLFIYL